MTCILGLFTAALFALGISTVQAQTFTPTFESMSIDWTPPGGVAGQAYATFAPVGAVAAPTRSLDLSFDAAAREYRGSLLFLTPDTEYNITLHLDGVPIETATARTWAETFPIARTVEVPTGSQSAPLTIDGIHGSATGYVLYVPAPGGDNTLDASAVPHSVVITDSTYVVLRGFTFVNAQEAAIVIWGSDPVNNIVIEDNEITNWGRIDAAGIAMRDHGILSKNGKGVNFGRLIIQNNRIYDPRGGANSWATGHPIGAKAISLKNSSGNNVIRFNEITAVEGKFFMDGIGGATNDSDNGAPGKDSDIYGNDVSGVWDDAIEAEGGGRNVRIWGNRIAETFIGIAIAPVRTGPIYIARNVIARTRRSVEQGYGSGLCFKMEGYGGTTFILHNTTYSSPVEIIASKSFNQRIFF